MNGKVITAVVVMTLAAAIWPLRR